MDDQRTGIDRRTEDQPVLTERRRQTRRRREKVACPYCGHLDSLVQPHRPTIVEALRGYVRYRVCTGCHAQYTSTERADPVVSSQTTEPRIPPR